MEIFIFISLFILGTLFGSFSSVLIFRWKQKEGGIFLGRSHCPQCNNTLTTKELIPLVSYCLQKGKCKHCSHKIPKTYPLLECFFGILFVWIGYISIYVFHLPLGSIPMIFLFIFAFITGLYIAYDFLFMEIPIQSLVIFLVSFFILFILSYFLPFKDIYFEAKLYPTFHTMMYDKFLGAFILYTFAYIQILIPGSIFFLKKQQYKKIGELFVYFFLFPLVSIWNYIQECFGYQNPQYGSENEEDMPVWIGPGDLFIAIIIGLTLGVKLGIIAFFIAYLVGTLFAVPLLIIHKESAQKIPFGPFLGIGSLISLTFAPQLLDLLETYLYYFNM